MLLRVYFESGEFGAFLIECWSVCRRGDDGDHGNGGDDDDDQCFVYFFLPEWGCRFPILCSRAGPEYRRWRNADEEVMEESR